MRTTEEAAEMVLRAAGSSLKNYTMPATRAAIFSAVMEIQHDAMAEGNCGECVHRPTERKVQCAYPKCDGDVIVDDCCHKPRVSCQSPGKDCQAYKENSSCWAVCGGLSAATKTQTERKVPEVQSCDMPDADWLRYMADKFVRDEPICERLLFIADKYEQMVFANIPKFLHPKTCL